jgi:hypothetical protein
VTNPEEVDRLSRRDFMRTSGGVMAGLLGLLGIASALGSQHAPTREQGYGSSTFGGLGAKKLAASKSASAQSKLTE